MIVVQSAPLSASVVWRVWVTKKGDIYFGSADLAGVTKVSFHSSGICRNAFTEQHGRPVTMSDRVMERWKRPQVPLSGSEHFARLLWLAVPTDYLSQRAKLDLGKTVPIPAAAAGAATFIELGLGRGAQRELEAGMARSEVVNGVLAFAPTLDKLSVFVRWYHGQWENRDMNLPAAPKFGADASLRFWASDAGVERPIRLNFHLPTKDYETLMITELGGRVVPGEEGLNWVGMSPPVVRDPK